ncbi:hypothetical protein R1sor_007731 [Riccia sorocarpa]|uniref:Uncharacterized protein n=1 Tax=Riccia sorocarpa TaxID=122646 RepID=A0ABD3HRA3_9MARC
MQYESEMHDGDSPDREMLESAYTYDEMSMRRSHNFLMALQELKNLRPQLYSAAEYCESSYLYSDQKQMVLDNLKDYSVKALVNAVDHLGTVAFKLNDLLTQQFEEVSSIEIRTASLAQRLRSCHEHSDREGLKQQSLAKSTQANHKHYVLPDATADVAKRIADQQEVVMLRETFDPEQIHPYQSQGTTADGASSSRNLAWHFAVDRSPAKNGGSSTLSRPPSYRQPESEPREPDNGLSRGSFLLSNSNSETTAPSAGTLGSSGNRITSKFTSRSKSVERSRSIPKGEKKSTSRSQSTERRPSVKGFGSNGKVSSSPLERSVSQLNFTEPDKDNQTRPGPARSKSLLRSLLSRGRNDQMDLQGSPASRSSKKDVASDVYDKLFIRVGP